MIPSSSKHILIVNNHDSFVYNLVQMVRETGYCSYDLVTNNSIDLSDFTKYDGILLSPGPGLPQESGQLCRLIADTYRDIPILGICLGHQAIAEVFGASLIRLEAPLHGHRSPLVITDHEELLFRDTPSEIIVGHYHSWVIKRDSCPPDLTITALNDKGLIMAIRHRTYPVRGLQFHPESVMTPEGSKMINNWIASL